MPFVQQFSFAQIESNAHDDATTTVIKAKTPRSNFHRLLSSSASFSCCCCCCCFSEMLAFCVTITSPRRSSIFSTILFLLGLLLVDGWVNAVWQCISSSNANVGRNGCAMSRVGALQPTSQQLRSRPATARGLPYKECTAIVITLCCVERYNFRDIKTIKYCSEVNWLEKIDRSVRCSSGGGGGTFWFLTLQLFKQRTRKMRETSKQETLWRNKECCSGLNNNWSRLLVWWRCYLRIGFCFVTIDLIDVKLSL